MKMSPQTKIDIMQMAQSAASDWFRIGVETDVPDLDPPDHVWTDLNERYPANAVATASGPTAMDHLFANTYRYHMARLWMEESAKYLRSFLARGT